MAKTNSNNPIVVKTGGIGAGGAILSLLLIGGGSYAAYKLVNQRKKNSAEKELDSEAGQIALQLKNVFQSFPVSDSAFQSAWLQVNASNKAEVFRLYRNLTGRNLSDDISKRITPSAQARSTKVEQYNSKPGKLFSITGDNKIKFEVAKGDFIRFAPGQKTPIKAYNSPFGIILNEINNPELNKKLKSNPNTVAATVSISIKPSARLFKVEQTLEIPYEGIRKADGFFQAVRPFVNTRKVFAAIRILAGINPATKKPVYLWIDARDMVTSKQLKGLGNVLKVV